MFGRLRSHWFIFGSDSDSDSLCSLSLVGSTCWSLFVNNRHGAFIKYLLDYIIMGVGKSGDLGQVSDIDHLVILSEHPQLLAYHLSSASADASVNLVKDEGGSCVSGRQNRFKRQ